MSSDLSNYSTIWEVETRKNISHRPKKKYFSDLSVKQIGGTNK